MSVKSDIEIAQAANILPIQEIGAKLGIPSEALVPYGHDKAKISAEFINSNGKREDGKLILVTAVSPTPAGEGKTTTTVGLGDGDEPHRQADHDLPARAEPGTVFRHEGRRSRRRLRAGRADDRYQPALHRRLSRHRCRPQPARRADRQPHALGQPAQHRPAARHLAARRRHERPRPALDHVGTRRLPQRRGPRGRLRHHGRLRDHGDFLSRDEPVPISRTVSATSCSATREATSPLRCGSSMRTAR